MFAVIENVEVRGVRALEPRQPEPGQKARLPECAVSVIVAGARGDEMKEFKAPITDMAEMLALVGKKVEEMRLDINEWDLNGRKGVSYKLNDGSLK